MHPPRQPTHLPPPARSRDRSRGIGRLASMFLMAATLTVVMLAVAHMCSGTTGSGDRVGNGHDRTDHGLEAGGPQPETAAPGVVADHALRAMFTWTPGTTTTAQAMVGARPWLTGALARDAATPTPDSGVHEPAQWQAWARSGDVIVATTRIDAIDIDGLHATVAVAVTQQVLHRDATATPYRRLELLATVEHTEHGWRLATYQTR